MNESYPSRGVSQQNPMKHCLLHRVATIDPMIHGRFIVLSMGTLCLGCIFHTPLIPVSNPHHVYPKGVFRLEHDGGFLIHGDEYEMFSYLLKAIWEGLVEGSHLEWVFSSSENPNFPISGMLIYTEKIEGKKSIEDFDYDEDEYLEYLREYEPIESARADWRKRETEARVNGDWSFLFEDPVLEQSGGESFKLANNQPALVYRPNYDDHPHQSRNEAAFGGYDEFRIICHSAEQLAEKMRVIHADAPGLNWKGVWHDISIEFLSADRISVNNRNELNEIRLTNKYFDVEVIEIRLTNGPIYDPLNVYHRR